MAARLNNIFGGKKHKSSGSKALGKEVSQVRDPSSVLPPLLPNVFGRPPSYTYAPAFSGPPPLASSGPPPGPPPLASSGPPPLLPNIFGRPTSHTYPLPASGPPPIGLSPILEVPGISAATEPNHRYNAHFQSFSARTAGLSDRTYRVDHADAVSTFTPDLQQRTTGSTDQISGSSTLQSVGSTIRPPTKRALRVYSRDVTSWQQQFSGSAAGEAKLSNRNTDTEKIVVSPPEPVPIGTSTMGASLGDLRKVRGSTPPIRAGAIDIAQINDGQHIRAEESDSSQNERAITNSLNKPTCSLNLICYRPGSQGCVLQQVRVVSRERFEEENHYQKAVTKDQGLIQTDQEFFQAIRDEYTTNMCGFWRRYLTLKTLRHIRLLSYTPTTRPVIVPLDDFTLQEVFHAYNNPSTVTTEHDWINWVFRLRQRDCRHALEFVEGWSGFRIGLVGSLPWVAATFVGILWTVKGGDAQTAFTVAGFILTVGTSLLALLAIVSKIES